MKKILIAILGFIVMACTGGENHDIEHKDHNESIHSNQNDEHQSESESISHTLYSDSYEFFIESDHFIINEPSHLTIHITRLSDYSPLRTDKIKVRFDDTNEIECEKVRPGIYLTEIVPSETGHREMIITFNDVDLVSFKTKIEVYQDEAKAHSHHEKSSPGGDITFTKEQAWKSPFRIEKVKQSFFSSVLTTSGEMLAMPGEKQSISAQSNGIVLFSTKNLVQGSKVKNKQELFTISGQNITENNINVLLDETRNRYLLSKSQYDRHKTLFANKIISEKQFNETRYQFLKDSVEFYTLVNNSSDGGIKVFSPLSGYLHELNVSEGQYVETGQIIATVSTNKVLLLRADLPQNFYPYLNKIVSTRFRPAYSNKTYSIENLNGRLLARGSSVAENNHYIPVYFEVQNDGSLLEGAFAEFYLILNDQQPTITLPVQAIMEEYGKHFVYVQTSGESYSKRYIVTGESDGNRIAILDGLQHGEYVVTEGTTLIKTASMGNVLPEHNHAH